MSPCILTPCQKQGELIENGKKYLESLEEITVDALWRSVIRSVEVERRLGREHAVRDDLEDAFEVCKPDEKEQGKGLLAKIASEAREFCYGPCRHIVV